MKIFEIIFNIINNPNAPRFYRDLKSLLKSQNREKEADAIEVLLSKKFKKNDINTSISEEQ